MERLKQIFKKKRNIYIGIVVAILAVIGWKTFISGQKQPEYQTATVEKGTLVVSVSESGQVSAANSNPVTTQISGTVSNVYVKNGDRIEQGQAIADIVPDQTSAQRQASAYATYLAAQNTLNSAQAKMNSLQSALFKANQTFVNGAGTQNPTTDDPKYIEQKADWLQAEADYKNQSAVINQAQAALNSAALSYQQSSSTIVAPTSGTIENLSITPGAVISGSTGGSTSSTSNSQSSSGQTSANNASEQTIATINTGGNPVITVNLSEVDAPKVSLGQKATITLDAFPNQTFTGKISSINTTGVVSSGVTTYPANITLDTNSSKIYPNMSATANIITQTEDNVLLIPSSAVQTQNGQSMVRVLKNGAVQQVAVETGASSDTQTEIKSGLSEGDTIVTYVLNSNQTTGSGSSPFSGRGSFGGGRAVMMRGGGG